jgi:ribonuclease PH
MQITKKPGAARNQDGTWRHAALKAEHVALVNAGSIAPTRMLANRYAVSVTTIKEVLAENAIANASNDPPILHCHDPFGRCKSMV